MGTAATMADETEEDEEKSLVRWGKIIRKWSPSFKTIGKIIYNENSRCKKIEKYSFNFSEKKVLPSLVLGSFLVYFVFAAIFFFNV